MAHPTFTQPEALRLADDLKDLIDLHSWAYRVADEAAAELRRLYAANIDCVDHFNALKAERDELLEALARYVQQDMAHGLTDNNLHRTARAAIAKATGGQA